MATSTGTAQGGVPVLVITHTREHLTEDLQVIDNNEPTPASSPTQSLTDNYTRGNGLVRASKSFRWSSVALVHTHYDPALWA